MAMILGCGSSGSASSSTALGSSNPTKTQPKNDDPSLLETPLVRTSLSKAQYVAKANIVCKTDMGEILKSFAAYRDELPRVRNRKLFAGASHHFILPSLQLEFDHLHYLGAPTKGQPHVEHILAALQHGVYSGRKQPVTSPKQLQAIFARFNRLTAGFGIHRCPVRKSLFSLSK